MEIDVISLFPELFVSPLAVSILGRAQNRGLLTVRRHDLRQWAEDTRGTVDDAPFGGGGGMVLMPAPLKRAVEGVKQASGDGKVILLAPDGERLTQQIANELSLEGHLILVCGHYRGVDERFRKRYVDREISVGDYVLTGGELPALVLVDSIVRLLPGVLGNFESALADSFQDGLLDCPWYTRPQVFDGDAVPAVLMGGNRNEIRKWRREQAIARTRERRPDMKEAR